MRLVAASFLITVTLIAPAHADGGGAADPPPHEAVSLIGAGVDVQIEGHAGTGVHQASTQHTITLHLGCGLSGGTICHDAQQCVSDGADGYVYDVYRDGAYAGQTCITGATPAEPRVVTPAQVAHAFRRLHWPSSRLLVQPVGGRTLVNFATNFYTDNTAPHRHSVTLLGQRIVIEATPTTYTWRFDDGETTTTSQPGHPYPHLDITHDYRTSGHRQPSLDTTYTGRYHLPGGPWITIPDPLTITGTPVALEVTTATPQLVYTAS